MPFVIRSRIKRPAPAPVPTSDPTLVITEIIQPAAPVVVPESVVVPTTAAPEPVADQTPTSVSVFSHPSLAAKKQNFLEFLAKRR